MTFPTWFLERKTGLVPTVITLSKQQHVCRTETKLTSVRCVGRCVWRVGDGMLAGSTTPSSTGTSVMSVNTNEGRWTASLLVLLYSDCNVSLKPNCSSVCPKNIMKSVSQTKTTPVSCTFRAPWGWAARRTPPGVPWHPTAAPAQPSSVLWIGAEQRSVWNHRTVTVSLQITATATSPAPWTHYLAETAHEVPIQSHL